MEKLPKALSLAGLGLEVSTVAPRFWSHVEIKADDGACWPWTASRGRKGYGRFRAGSRTDGTSCKLSAHRVAYEITSGPPPAGAMILHCCDNPCCCNPQHLRIGSHQENMAEMRLKGRRRGKSAKGEAVKLAKLTERAVREMRRRHPGESIAALARAFGVGETTAAYAIKGINWTHVQ